MMTIRVLIADDHQLVRSGLSALIHQMESVEVVGEASDGREALQLVREATPDIALMDISMKELNGIEATQRIAAEYSRTKVIVLSMHANEEYVARALRAGASGYLLKDAATQELETALRAVASGQVYLSPAISRQVLDSYLEGGTGLDAITPRQREILQLIAEGKSTKEIARTLNLSVKTVETHRAQIMERLDIRDVAGLTRFALRKGLIQPED